MINIQNKESQESICPNLETKDFSNCPVAFESGNIEKDGVNYWFVKGVCSKCGVEEYTEDTYTESPLPYNSLNYHLTNIRNLLG